MENTSLVCEPPAKKGTMLNKEVATRTCEVERTSNTEKKSNIGDSVCSDVMSRVGREY
jgi:hypothetical protein